MTGRDSGWKSTRVGTCLSGEQLSSGRLDHGWDVGVKDK